MQLAQRVGVNVGDLINITVDLPEASIPRVIGKGGSNLKAIEEVCGEAGTCANTSKITLMDQCFVVMALLTWSSVVQGEHRRGPGQAGGSYQWRSGGLSSGQAQDRGGHPFNC